MFNFLRYAFWPCIWIFVVVVITAINPGSWVLMGEFIMEHPVGFTITILSVYIFYRLFRYAGRFYYEWYKSKKLITLKVILPRGDSKIDQEKRTEKDFREKIAIMEQLFRALWEVRNLNFQQMIHFWFFRHIIMSFEMFLEKNQLMFFVVTQPSLASIVEKQVTSYYPNAEVTPEETPDICPKGSALMGYHMTFSRDYYYPIRCYTEMQDDPLNGIANVLSKLKEEEKAAVQVVLTPSFSNRWAYKARQYATKKFKGEKEKWGSGIPIIGPILGLLGGVAKVASTDAPGASSGDSYVRMLQPEEELYKRMGEKAGMNFYHASIRILASSETYDRSMEITNNMQVAFNAYKDLYGNYLENKRMFIPFMPLKWNAWFFHRLWKHRIGGYFSNECLMGGKELAGLFHFPDSRYNKIPIIQWSTYKVLPPPPSVPKEGVVLGINKYRGVETNIRFLPKDRTRHHYVIGKSGSGKSTLLSYMSRQDIANGDGVCMVDPHGDLIEDALAHSPKERAKDIVVFNPADANRPMGLNLLEVKSEEEKDRASLDAMQIFIKLFGNEIFGPRIQHYFRNGCLTLMDDEEEGATILDVPRMFVDEEFQKYKVAKCRNKVVRSFWEHEMAKTGQREKEEMIPYFSSKFGPFITNTTMRNIIGQPKSAFNIREIMDNKKVLLVNLSKGKIGDTNAQLLGLIFVNKINMAALSRADIPREERQRFYLYVDEFQNFVTDAFVTILSEARKYELALIMAHQYIGQLVGKTSGYGDSSTQMRDAIFGNVGTIMSFKIGAEDSEYMAKEYAPVLSEQDVIGIPNFSAYTKLNINNVQSRPFSLTTIYDESDRNEKLAKLIKEYSRMKYGRKKVFVDQEIEDRIGIGG
ncbi:MAG: type IV secretion system DNA-binding domain-containing protein [Candidatus Peribacteraceae bacterium]|nr:type IV secretion system DNA-binding domain-containing protein [Candidatus Peribacteraceae bacterium]MDP7454531.1 type IV secretion system DNA-binding domain-containing protein [Candidatus Peribacteraceae bacterium]MDP7645882.1 type IV secretion system DNA-binding domain-containing protein [Candidatus Peribacteraceae bacterium]